MRKNSPAYDRDYYTYRKDVWRGPSGHWFCRDRQNNMQGPFPRREDARQFRRTS